MNQDIGYLPGNLPKKKREKELWRLRVMVVAIYIIIDDEDDDDDIVKGKST